MKLFSFFLLLFSLQLQAQKTAVTPDGKVIRGVGGGTIRVGVVPTGAGGNSGGTDTGTAPAPDTLIMTATNRSFYFDADAGDDTRTVQQAQDSTTPWKTINKMFTALGERLPGDGFFLKRGVTFRPTVNLDNNPMVILANFDGSPTQPVIFGAYGTGTDKAIVSGFSLATSPVKTGNIYEYTVNVWEQLSIVRLNGVLTPVARFPKIAGSPNGGFLSDRTRGGPGYNQAGNWLYSVNVPDNFDFAGGDLVTKENHYIMSAHPISSVSNDTVYFTQTKQGEYEGDSRYGFFFQNSKGCLTQNGDWAYNRSTGKLSLYWDNAATLPSVEYASPNLLIYQVNAKNVHYKDLLIEGANVDAVKIQMFEKEGLVFRNVHVRAIGQTAFWSSNGANKFTLLDSKVEDCYSTAINMTDPAYGSRVVNNTIQNISTVLGAHRYSFHEEFSNGARVKQQPRAQNGGAAVGLYGDDAYVAHNDIMNTGYNGITFTGARSIIENNYVYWPTKNTNDGSGIYSFKFSEGFTEAQQRHVRNNLVICLPGFPYGTNDTLYEPNYGIYMDDQTRRVLVENNYVTGAADAAYFGHHNQYVTFRNNVAYDSKTGFMAKYGDNNSTMLPEGNRVVNNTFVLKQNRQKVYDISLVNVLGSPGFDALTVPDVAVFDSNSVYMPYSYTDYSIKVYKPNIPENSEPQDWYTLEGLKSKFPTVDQQSTVYTGTPYTVNTFVNRLTESAASNPLTGSLNGSASFDRRTVSYNSSSQALQAVSSASTAFVRSTFMLNHTGTVNAGEVYRVRFRTWSASSGFMIDVWNNNWPGSADRLMQFFVNTTPRVVELFFPSVAAAEGFVLNFRTYDTNPTFYIDDYTVDRVTSVTYPDLDNDIKFIYNAGKTASAVTYTGGTYTNLLTGQTIPASPVTLQPRKAVIGTKLLPN